MRLFRKALKIIGWGSAGLITLLVLSAPLVLLQMRADVAAGRDAWTSERRASHKIIQLAIRAEQKVERTAGSVAHVFSAGFTAGKSHRVHLADKSGRCSVVRQILVAASSDSNTGGGTCADDSARKPLMATLPSFSGTDSMAPVSFQTTDSTKAAPQQPVQESSAPAVPPVPVVQPLTALSSHTDCSKGTLLTVIAHEDDDLLFMNPDLLNAATAGECLRTVYVTAGDAGQDQAYWLSRENGAKAAYAKLYDQPDSWTDTQAILNGKTIETAILKDVPQLSLVFLRLPDGNIHGDGFPATHQQSLKSLLDGTLPSMQTVDGSGSYTRDDLIAGLLTIMNTDEPAHIHTQGLAATADGDHADHVAVGEFTMLAAQRYQPFGIITQYAGYPERSFAPNLSAADIAVKQQIFFAYAVYDSAVCGNIEECATAAYSNYLSREFKAEVAPSSTAVAVGP